MLPISKRCQYLHRPTKNETLQLPFGDCSWHGDFSSGKSLGKISGRSGVSNWLGIGFSSMNFPLSRPSSLSLWQCGLWSFQTGGIKLEMFLPKNQHTQWKILNFKNWTNKKPTTLPPKLQFLQPTEAPH